MKHLHVDCIEVRESDGMGMHELHVAYVSNQNLADELIAQNKGWRSSRPFKMDVSVFDTLDEYNDAHAAEVRATALRKLTPTEIKALGL